MRPHHSLVWYFFAVSDRNLFPSSPASSSSSHSLAPDATAARCSSQSRSYRYLGSWPHRLRLPSAVKANLPPLRLLHRRTLLPPVKARMVSLRSHHLLHSTTSIRWDPRAKRRLPPHSRASFRIMPQSKRGAGQDQEAEISR